MNLRPYQVADVERIRAAFAQHRRVCYQLPTGGGKTVLAAFVAHHGAAKQNRVYFLVHRREIRKQASRTFDDFQIRHGIVAPGFTQTADLVQVASVDTLARRLDQAPEPDLIICDEGHHATAPKYRRVFDRWPSAKLLLVTATPQRLDGRGLAEVCDALITGPTTQELIDTGYLAAFDYFAPPSNLDLSAVPTRMGDWSVREMLEAVERSTITGDAVAHLRKLAPGSRAIAFCISVDDAAATADRFRAQGFRAASIDGGMTPAQRDAIVADFGAGRLDVLTSCDLISEGFDVPECDAAILLRPTKSLTMFLQQVGRCLRPKRDGRRAVILDHVNNAQRHGLPNDARVWSLEGRKRRAVASGVSQCASCFRVFAVGTTPRSPADCPDQRTGLLGDSDCPYVRAVEKPEGRPVPARKDGELVAVAQVQPGWLPLEVGLRTSPLAEVVAHAVSLDQFHEIAKARGYKAGWAFGAWQRRRRAA